MYRIQPYSVSFVSEKRIGQTEGTGNSCPEQDLKILDEFVKQSNWTQQGIFLSKCRDQNATPKGLKKKVPKGRMNKDQ